MSKEMEEKGLQAMDEQFLSRVSSYLPAWQYAPGDGQPEAAVLYAAWRLLEDTRQRLARLPEKHEAEFLRAWGLDPAPAVPMSVYAALTAPDGEAVPAGSELYLSGSGTRLWRTTHSAHAESLALSGQILESGRQGRLFSLPLPSRENPTRLFDFRAPGHQRQAVRFAHRDAFRSRNGCTACLEFPETGEELLNFLADSSKVRWTLEENGTVQEISMPQHSGVELIFSLPPAPLAAALVADVQPGVVAPASLCGEVCVSTQRENLPGEAVICDDGVVVEETFHPFGMSLEPWRSCCLSCPDALTLRGGVVSLSYTLDHMTREEALPGTGEQPEYRPVMRRMPVQPPQPRDVYAQSVAWEYWNGSAWLPIPGTGKWSSDFAGEETARPVQAQFRWPSDARPCTMQGQEEYWLRWRVTQADGIGYLPRRLHIPEVCALRFEAVLRESPVEVSLCSGLTSRFLTREPGGNAPLFPPLTSKEDGWWLQFDHAPHGDVLALFAVLSGRGIGFELTAWESTPEGLHQLGLEDGTDGLAHSGLLRLSGIEGRETMRFGRLGWWICFRDRNGTSSGGQIYPRLTGLYPGAVCLRAVGADTCLAGESVLPLRGGAISGVTLTGSFGGAPPEQNREMLARARQRRHHLGRGVSPLDVEQLVRERFRDVVRTRSRREGNRVMVAILMRDTHQHSAAFTQRREAIVRLLQEETVMPTLGLTLEVREPNFYPIQAMAWLQSDPEDNFQTDSEIVRLALEQFLHPVTGRFRGNGWRMGDLPEEQEMRIYLRDRLPHVKLVKLVLTAMTPQGLEVDCGKVRDPFALPVSGNHTIHEVREEGLK